MDFYGIMAELKAKKLAGRRFQKEGREKFRDCVTVRRDGRLLFERFNYGEAAGLVAMMWGTADGDFLNWEYDDSAYSRKDEAPKLLTGITEDGALQFDGAATEWKPAADLKSMYGMGFFKKLFS